MPRLHQIVSLVPNAMLFRGSPKPLGLSIIMSSVVAYSAGNAGHYIRTSGSYCTSEYRSYDNAKWRMRKAKGVEGLKVPYNINHHHFQTWFQEGN